LDKVHAEQSVYVSPADVERIEYYMSEVRIQTISRGKATSVSEWLCAPEVPSERLDHYANEAGIRLQQSK
jgi:hypothetical protein